MPRSSKGIQCSDPVVVRSGSVAVLVMGILVTVHYILLARGAVFHFAARILDVAMDNGGSRTAELFVALCLIAGGTAAFVGAAGLVASHLESRPGQVFSFTGKAILMLWFFAMWLCNANMQTFVEPVVQQQAEEICSLNFYQMYRRAVGCNETRLWTPYDEKLECKEECQGRLETIRMMGGCRYLELMCQDHEFQSMQEGYCLMSVKNGSLSSETHPPMIASSKNQTVSWDCCREACDGLVSCAGFSFIEDAQQCFLVAPARPASVKGCEDIRWSHDISPDAKVFKNGLPKITGTDGTEGVQCFRKGKSRVLEILAQKGALTSAVNVVMAVTLLCSTICSCCFQYTLATRRQGKKGAAALVMKMLCPCMQPGRKEDPKRNWLALDDVVSNPSTADSDSA